MVTQMEQVELFIFFGVTAREAEKRRVQERERDGVLTVRQKEREGGRSSQTDGRSD